MLRKYADEVSGSQEMCASTYTHSSLRSGEEVWFTLWLLKTTLVSEELNSTMIARLE